MSSARSKLMPIVMRLRGAKRRYKSEELTRARIAKQAASPASFLPPTLTGVTIRRTTIEGWPVFEIMPFDRPNGRAALYVHGGSFVYEISRQHWTLVADLVRTTGTTINVPIYPLAPIGTAGSIIPRMTDLATALISDVGVTRMTIMGDSAGGTIALATAMMLRDRGVPTPRTILISPELDLSLSDPLVARIEPWDPWLAIAGARVANELYRGDLSLLDPLVSPLFGSLTGLSPVTLFSGTRDMLNADAASFVDRATLAGLPVDYHEARGMIHVYPLLPIPEAQPAREVMRAVLRGPG
jgi:acetyl esterase/lipase